METNERQAAYPAFLEGPARFLGVVFETIEAHIERTREEYAEIVTGVEGEDVGDVGHAEEAVLHLYVLGDVDREEARERIELALNRIANDHNMEMARHNVQITFEDEEA